MPLYEYQCQSCGERFEVLQKFSDPPADSCPSCGGAVEKLISSPAIQFKGTGWYVTDYAGKGKSESGNGASGRAAEKKNDSGEEKTKSSSASGESKETPAATSSAQKESSPTAGKAASSTAARSAASSSSDS